MTQHKGNAAFDLDDDLPNCNTFPHHLKTFENACARDPLLVDRVRKIVVAIQASVQRRDKYHKWIKEGMQ
jgi:hypothetical protein